MLIFLTFIIATVVSLLFAPHKSRTIAPLAIFFFMKFIASLISQFLIGASGPKACAIAWLPILFFKNEFEKHKANNDLKKKEALHGLQIKMEREKRNHMENNKTGKIS